MISLRRLYQSPKSAKVVELVRNGKKLVTPTYFPAVSGAKLSLPVRQLVEFLVERSYPRILVSSYDLFKMNARDREELGRELADYSRSGLLVFLDSGIFESFWRGDSTWDFEGYKTIVTRVASDFYTSFDVLPEPSQSESQFVASTEQRILLSESVSRSSEYIPIVHGTKPYQMISTVKAILNSHPSISRMIAVSERDCGVSLSERARTVLELRKILDESCETVILHVLGCGNPLSVALYAYCGADTFDSLDWAQVAIDRDELRTYDYAYHELSTCQCVACSRPSQDPIKSILLHNLLFYQDFMLKIQSMIRRNTLKDFLLQYLGPNLMKKLA